HAGLARSPLFSQGFLGDFVLKQGFCQQLLQAGILGFQLLEPLGIRDAHAPELVFPEVIAGLGETMLAAQLLDRHTCLGLAQEANNLLFGESLLHVQSPDSGYWTLKSGATQTGGTSYCYYADNVITSDTHFE